MQGIGGTGQSGQSRGAVGLTPTGVELGIDIGIGQIGVSTDYGGGIVVGIAGQKIVWGTEGGKISYNVGGFQVTVEARDCVVVETRRIAGQVVGIHTYPDPGCKLPPETPTPTPTPTETPTPTPEGIKVPRTTDLMWVVCTEKVRHLGGYNYELKSTIQDETEPVDQYRLPFTIERRDKFGTLHRAEKGVLAYYRFKRLFYENRYHEPVTVLMSTEYYDEYVNQWFAPHQSQELAYFGTGIQINNYFDDLKAWNTDWKTPSGRFGYVTETVTAIIPLVSPPLPPPPPPRGGNQPPMPDKCCESLKADVEDIRTVLAVEAMLKKKVEIPGELLEIQTDGKSTPKPEIILNYGQMAHAILLAINRYGIDAPIKVEIEDTDTTKKGNQSDEFVYNSPAVALQAILELLWEIKGDSASRLKIQVRMAYAITRTLKIVAGVGESLRTILKMLGLPFRYDKKALPLEFNLAAAKRGKGFGGEKGKGKGTSATEAELETLLPGLLQETEYQVPTPVFDAADEDIRELLVKILIAVKSLPSK